MTVDRESRVRLADLAQKVPDGTFKASVTHNTGSPLCEVVIECPFELWAFMETATPETVLALLADLDTAERNAESLTGTLRQALKANHFFRAEKLADALRELSERAQRPPARGPDGYKFDVAVEHAKRALAEHGDVS